MDPAMEVEMMAIAKQKPMLDAMASGESEVQRFYKNSVVFVTGGSGFLGKQLIEKLFRCCEISKMFILLRTKKGIDGQKRVETILKDPVFDTLHRQKPKFHEKIYPIQGDVASLRLGIKDHDWQILTEEVQVIFHAAATTRFEEPLAEATLVNVRGTRECLALGKACKQLKSFVHVSTAFCQATEELVDCDVTEKFYPAPITPDALISLAENVDSGRLNNITSGLIHGWQNTYTFTKAITEELVRVSSDSLPICIVRPGIVLSVYREPYPGWLDSSCIYGVIGIVLGCGVGIIHTLSSNLNSIYAFIPCDYVNNAIIVAAKETATNQVKGGDATKIYTVTSTNRNKVKGGDMFNYGSDPNSLEYKVATTPQLVYYPWKLNVTNEFLYTILSFLTHTIPAVVADFICFILGKPRRYLKTVRKFHKISGVMRSFSYRQWNFVDGNLESLFAGLSKQDQVIFNFDVTDISWKEHFLYMVIGLRKYIVKDGLKGTDYANRKRQYFKYIHYTLMILCGYALWKVVCFFLCLCQDIVQ